MTSTSITIPRSALFVAADDHHRHGRAFASGADAVILDLEDAVLPAAKDDAREALADSLQARSGSALTWLRVNSPLLPVGRADLEAACDLDIDAILVPKADPQSVDVAAAAGVPIVALVETAAGILAAERTARHPAVAGLMFGPLDLGAELGVVERPDGNELVHARGLLVLAAAAAGKPGPLDGPCVSPRDERALRLELERAKQLGFIGKTCIHPAQVDPVNAAFSPDPDEVTWARRVVDAFERASGGVTVLDGEMIDRPVVLRADRILSKASGARRDDDRGNTEQLAGR